MQFHAENGACTRRRRPQVAPRTFTAVISVISVLAAVDVAAADQFPSKRITLVLPFGVGSPPDTLGRLIAQSLSTRLGQSVVVMNRPGAGSTIATKEVATATPDGYTLLQVNSALAYAPLLFPNVGYDPRTSFIPIAGIASWPLMLVINADLPVSSVQGLVAYAKANAGKVNIGHTLGSPPQVLAEMFRKTTGAPVNAVPYPQPPQLMGDLVSGQIQASFLAGAGLISLVKNGKLKTLAVTSGKRFGALPDVPTVGEAGLLALSYDPTDWTGIVAPAGTPRPVVATLSAAILESLSSAEVQASIRLQGADVMALAEPQFAAFVADELSKWPTRFREAGVGSK